MNMQGSLEPAADGKLSRGCRRIPVTLRARVADGAALPPPCVAAIVGRSDDGRGVEAMVVQIDGSTGRPDGSTYHITWSLQPGRKAVESNDVIAKAGEAGGAAAAHHAAPGLLLSGFATRVRVRGARCLRYGGGP